VQPLLDAFDSAEGVAIASALGLDDLSSWFVDEDNLQRWLIGTFSHHGRPQIPGSTYVSILPRLWQANSISDPISGVADIGRRVRQWIPDAWQSDAAAFPSCPELLHAFNGLLTLADWLGSDARFFPFAANTEDDRRFESSFARAREALTEVGINVEHSRSCVSRKTDTFGLVSEHRPNEMQACVASLGLVAEGSLTILESETGSGKTEAALAHFATLFRSGTVDGMYFALPTRTAATQIYRRVVDAVERMYKGPGAGPATVLAVPGYLEVDGVRGYRLPEFTVRWADDANDQLRERGWAAEQPKRYLAAAIAVGTVDQALLSALQISHAHLRASSLLRHLLVVDEVHASDAYMTRILREVVRRQLRAGGHVLLMSATLGSSAKDRFLSDVGRPRPTSIDDAIRLPYPLVTSCHAKNCAITERPVPAARHRKMRVEVASIITDPRAIAERALDAARRGARVLVVRNTVADCVATQLALEDAVHDADDEALLFSCADRKAPHHSRYARDDRRALDTEVETRFGRKTAGSPCVLVATQTVEQSLDIDADLLITSLCPMDVLLQRMGRVHRHPERRRASGFVEALTVVLVPEPRDMSQMLSNGRARGAHGFGTVYEYLTILEATWRLLESNPVLEIPAMSRRLVESATHAEALALIERELGDPWIEHGRFIQGLWLGSRRIASLGLVDWTLPFPAVQGDALFPSGAMSHDIGTRLGQDDRLVSYPLPRTGPFGMRVDGQTIPAHFVRGVASDAVAENMQEIQGGFSFSFGGHRFLYDRLGLRPNKNPRPE
jgi:CRISPR-associated endonuclease/helicase Cas3